MRVGDLWRVFFGGWMRRAAASAAQEPAPDPIREFYRFADVQALSLHGPGAWTAS